MKVWAPKTAYRAKRDGTWDALIEEIGALPSLEAILDWRRDFILERHRTVPWYWQEAVWEALEDRAAHFHHKAMDDAWRATL